MSLIYIICYSHSDHVFTMVEKNKVKCEILQLTQIKH